MEQKKKELLVLEDILGSNKRIAGEIKRNWKSTASWLLIC